MERSVERARRWVWSERLRRFDASGTTVKAFCERERVSVPSFYQWRRKLDGQRDEPGAATAKTENAESPPGQAFVPVMITQSAGVQLRLPNGVQFWLPGGDAVLLAAAIEAAGRLAGTSGEEAAC